MHNGFIQFEVDDAELKEIFNELNKAQETIYKCYSRLQSLGIVKFKKSPSENDD